MFRQFVKLNQRNASHLKHVIGRRMSNSKPDDVKPDMNPVVNEWSPPPIHNNPDNMIINGKSEVQKQLK